MAVEVGTAYVTVVPSAKGFAGTLQKDVGGEVATAGKTAGKTYGSALSGSAKGAMGALAGAAIATGAIGFLKESISGARESARVSALTASAIRSTGGAAKVTADQVGALSLAIATKTGVDDEAIQSASNLLLTFTNVRNEVGKGNDVFNQATQAAVDMGAVLGGDPSSNAIMLGKALNDPTKGLTALTRAGVSFSAGQATQVKAMQASGDTLGAQKLILGELKKEFGGAAEASGTAGEKFAVAFGNLQEGIGAALLPAIDAVTSKLTDFTNWIASNGTPAVAVLGVGLGVLGLHFTVLAATALASSASSLAAAGVAVGGWVASVAAQAASVAESAALWVMYTAESVAGWAKDAALTVGGFAAKVAATAAGWVATAAAHVAGWAVMTATTVAGWATTVATHVASWAVIVASTVASMAVTVATTVGGWIVMAASSLASAAALAVAWVIAFWPIALVIVAVVALVVVIVKNWATIKAATIAAWNAIVGWIRSAWSSITGAVSSAVGALTARVSSAWNSVRTATVGAWNGVRSAVSTGINGVVSFVSGLPGRILGALGNMSSTLLGAGRDLIQGFINGIEGMAGNIIGAITSTVTNALPDFVRKALGMGSPSKVFMQLGADTAEGMALGIASGGHRVQSAADALIPTGSAARAGFASSRTMSPSSSGPLVAVYPVAGQSESEIAEIAARKLMFHLASA